MSKSQDKKKRGRAPSAKPDDAGLSSSARGRKKTVKKTTKRQRAAKPSPQNLERQKEEVAASESADVEQILDHAQKLRIIEALLFAASEPLDEKTLGESLEEGDDVVALIDELAGFYEGRGVNLVKVAGKWAFRTAEDLSHVLERYVVAPRKLSRPALETLAIIAYHQPVTRAEIEEVRGVGISKGTLDVLMETKWVRLRGRRKVPGRPVTYGTTEAFLDHFGFESLADLPGLKELKGAGLLDGRLPPDFTVPSPRDDDGLQPDEEPLDAGDDQQTLLLPDEGEL